MRIRYVKTASGKYAVQVVSKRRGKLVVHKHIGSYQTEREKTRLIFEANLFIRDNDNYQQNLWEHEDVLHPTDVKITQSQPLFLYRLLSGIYDQLGLHSLGDELIKDLILARIYQPVSKRETVAILADSFGKEYSLKTVYRHLKNALDQGLKEKFQTALIQFAKEGLHDSLKLGFYDVTTLAFDSHAQKGLKDFGFSKDHRFQDVQIVIGLVVNRDGFPLYFDVFNGKTFEGSTFITIVENIRTLLQSTALVVIADAAMISRINIEALAKRNIGFIVGARLRNLPAGLQDQISREILGQDQKTTVVSYLTHRLICQYQANRAAKDKSDREKQVEKANRVIAKPSQLHGRYRFVESVNDEYTLNKSLIEKAEKLEGIKGYLTNTDLDEATVIDRYHDLWKIEKAFRVTKSDLEARPIFLQLDKTITCHLLIVFAGLAVSRFMEIKTGMSIHQILKIAQKVLTHKVTIPKTEETGYIETSIEDPELCGQLKKLRDLEH
jgi:transposase